MCISLLTTVLSFFQAWVGRRYCKCWVVLHLEVCQKEEVFHMVLQECVFLSVGPYVLWLETHAYGYCVHSNFIRIRNGTEGFGHWSGVVASQVFFSYPLFVNRITNTTSSDSINLKSNTIHGGGNESISCAIVELNSLLGVLAMEFSDATRNH